MLRVLALLPVSITAVACVSTTSIVSTSAVPRESLVSGAGVLETSAAEEPPSAETILGIDDEIRAFVHAQVDDATDPKVKLDRLLAGMRERGLLSLDYLESATQTVRDTYRDKQGNCLSFTMLFVALAREAGLDVSYQIIDIPPTWSSMSDIVTRNNHINAVVGTGTRTNYVVDFNAISAKGNYDTQIVSDSYALALYYSNVGAAAFVRKEYATSLVYFRKAIESFPQLSASWNNLGVLYSRIGSPEYAESAYLEGLAVNNADPSVLTNLAILYGNLGRDELAEAYRNRVRLYRLSNPYYHYSLALEAYDADRMREALSRLRKAIRLKDDEHQFHYLRGLAHYARGHLREAGEDFAQALRYARFAEVREQYEREIRALAGG